MNDKWLSRTSVQATQGEHAHTYECEGHNYWCGYIPHHKVTISFWNCQGFREKVLKKVILTVWLKRAESQIWACFLQKGVEFDPFEIWVFSCSQSPRYPNVFLERNQFFTTSFGSIRFFCLAISRLLIVSNSVQFKTDYLAYLHRYTQGVRYLRGCSVFSIQFFSR